MKQPNAIFKGAAVSSAVLLVAGFVSYRAGAFDSYFRTEAPAIQPEPAPAPTPDPAEDTPAPVDQTILLSTSKSAGVLIPVSPTPKSGEKSAAPPTFIGGSKSLAPLLPPKSGPATSTTAPTQAAPK